MLSILRGLGRPAFWLVVAGFLLSRPSEAAVPPYQAEHLTVLSSDVVVGEVISSSAAWADWPYGGEVILTTWVVRIDETWIGSASGQVEVVIPGGQVGTDKIVASCVPHLEVGDRAVLFLKEDLEGLPRYWVFGLERGAFDFLPNGELRQQGHDTETLSLTELQTRVAAAAVNRR